MRASLSNLNEAVGKRWSAKHPTRRHSRSKRGRGVLCRMDPVNDIFAKVDERCEQQRLRHSDNDLNETETICGTRVTGANRAERSTVNDLILCATLHINDPGTN